MPTPALLFDSHTPSNPADNAGDRERSAERWEVLRSAAGIGEEEPCLIALSGGADSVLLLQMVYAAAQKRAKRRTEPTSLQRWVAVHVDHGLRGDESQADAEFCARLCAGLGIRFVRVRGALDPKSPSLEAKAREIRYRALAREARRAGISTLLTGHHADDALETLLLRWLRGSATAGLPGLRLRSPLAGVFDSAEASESGSEDSRRLTLVRPLIGMRRAEIRAQLRANDWAWREDSSNASALFTRNRVRNELLPEIERLGGKDALDSLRAFERSVQRLEEDLAERTAHLAWSPPPYGPALRARSDAHLGGVLRRSEICALPDPLRRRALWRLLCEGTGHAPGRRILEQLQNDLASGRCTRRSLPGGWSLQLRAKALFLEPPEHIFSADPASLDSPSKAHSAGRQLELFNPPGPAADERALALPLGGATCLSDGRELKAFLTPSTPGAAIPQGPLCVELDAAGLPPVLTVRLPRPGDRFRALGAPGAKRLSRFLADCGVPRGERSRVPLVFAGKELIWVAGIRPAESRRIRPGRTQARVRLEIA